MPWCTGRIDMTYTANPFTAEMMMIIQTID